MSETNIIAALKRETGAITDALEKQRKSYIAWLLVGITLVSFFMTFLLLYINPQGINLRYTIMFGALIPSAILYLLLSRAWLKNGKKSFTERLCNVSGLHHRDDGCFAVSSAEKHSILPSHNKNKMETGLQGSHNGVSFAIQEVILTELKQDKKHKKRDKEYLRFWGVIARVKLGGRVYGHTVVMPPIVRQVFFKEHFSQHKKLKSPGDSFGKRYEIMSTDTVDAKMIITSSFKEQFMATGKSLRSYWSEASFKENEIFFAFQRFRPLIQMTPIWKPMTEKNLRQNISELESLFKLIDVLKNNQQIGR